MSEDIENTNEPEEVFVVEEETTLPELQDLLADINLSKFGLDMPFLKGTDVA